MKVSVMIWLTVMASLLVAPLGVRSASALPGLSVTDPANTWTPYGPHHTINHVLLKYYPDDSAEYTDFVSGQLDLADSGQAGTGPPASTWPTYDANPDWNVSAVQGGSVWHGIFFNGASSTWSGWGCDWQFYNSACGVEMRQAFAHMVDRPSFATGFGGLTPIYDDFAANKGLANGQLMQSPASNFCSWDTISNA